MSINPDNEQYQIIEPEETNSELWSDDEREDYYANLKSDEIGELYF